MTEHNLCYFFFSAFDLCEKSEEKKKKFEHQQSEDDRKHIEKTYHNDENKIKRNDTKMNKSDRNERANDENQPKKVCCVLFFFAYGYASCLCLIKWPTFSFHAHLVHL